MGLEKNLFNQFDLTTFTLDNNARRLYFVLRDLARPSRLTIRSIHTECVIIINEGKVTIQLKGMERSYPCKTNGNAVAKVYFTDLLQAFKDNRNHEINFTVLANTMIIDDRKISCQGKVIKSQSELGNYGLGTLNYGERTYDTPGWRSNEWYRLPKSGREVHYQIIRADAEKALLLLKEYGVEEHKLIHLMMEKVVKI